MEPGQRERIWRRIAVIVSLAALLISAAAIYGIKRLEAQSKPHVHLIREVNKFEAAPGKK
jgi:type VI protein secretion system component VasF